MTPAAPKTEVIPPRRIARNTVVQLVAAIAGKLLTFAFYVLLARKLGQNGFGDFVFSLSLALLFTVFSAFGTDAILTREVARDRSRLGGLFWTAIGIKLAFGALGVGLALTVSALAGYSGEVRVAVGLLAGASVLDLLAKTIG